MSKRAEEKAWKIHPYETGMKGLICENSRGIYIQSYEQAEKDIIALIESRISEILGDAQPAPVLRAELRELINKIEEK